MFNYGKISIIIPAYNVDKYIEKCIDSVLKQTYTNFELIVVDDGSTDNTAFIVDRFESIDKRIKVIHKKNGGLPAARNTGLNVATGKYIMFLDSDDWIEERCCSVALERLVANDADLVIFDYYKEFENKTIPYHAYKESELIYKRNEKNYFFIYDMRTITAWGKIYVRDSIDGIMFDENMKTAEDVDFNYRVYNKVDKVAYIHDMLLHYRILEKSAIHGFDLNIKQKLEYPVNKIGKYMLIDSEDMRIAYYSFVAIAYLLICQNGICLNNNYTIFEKTTEISKLRNDLRVIDMFKNIHMVNIPISRKLVVMLGKVHMNIGIAIIINIKQKVEKRKNETKK